jgi:hypothetical protein
MSIFVRFQVKFVVRSLFKGIFGHDHQRDHDGKVVNIGNKKYILKLKRRIRVQTCENTYTEKLKTY